MANRRGPDELKIEVIGKKGSLGTFDSFTSFEVTTDITSPFEASFEVGDDGSFVSLQDVISHGTEYKVTVNGLQRMKGRVEINDIPFDATGGAVIRFSVRTKLADAQYASASPNIKVASTSIKDFILKLYEPLGYAESDFSFDPAASRDLMTGKSTSGKGAPTRVDLEPIKAEQAKINPPESIYSAADRHLRRHGLMHWDAPDGKIVVSYPNDTQDPLYHFRMNLGANGRNNNVLRATKTADYSQVPSQIAVFGVGGKRNFAKSRVSAAVRDSDVVAAGMYRPVNILAEAIKTRELANAAVNREMSARRKRKDAYEIEVDGLSYWLNGERVPFGVDTVAEIQSDVAGGNLGAYYLHRVTMKRDTGSADTTFLSLLARDLWKLS